MAEEQIRFTQIEEGIASFERNDGSIIYYTASNVPAPYKEGDIIRAIVFGDVASVSLTLLPIDFIDLDHEAMEARRVRMAERTARIRARVHRTTNQK